MSVDIFYHIDLSGGIAVPVSASRSEGTDDCGPSDGRKYDGNHSYGYYLDPCPVSSGRISGGHLSDLCHDQFLGGSSSDKGIHRCLSGEKRSGTEKTGDENGSWRKRTDSIVGRHHRRGGAAW